MFNVQLEIVDLGFRGNLVRVFHLCAQFKVFKVMSFLNVHNDGLVDVFKPRISSNLNLKITLIRKCKLHSLIYSLIYSLEPSYQLVHIFQFTFGM